MSNFTDTLLNDSKKAGIRIAATQSVNLTKAALINLLEKKFDADQAKSLAKMLDTEYGTAVVGFMLGCILRYAPTISEHKNAKILGEEFVISSIATVGNEVISEIINIIPAMVNILDNIPDNPKLAMKENVNESLDSEEMVSKPSMQKVQF
jgi:hypothetical protein